jgi:type IV pilus assembly protein PilE
MKHAKGFTLIEIMVVVAILGIIASIAIPSYRDYVVRGKLVGASAQLADLRIKLEQSYQDNRNYTSYVDADCRYITGTNAGQLAVPADKYFSYACTTAASPDTYTLTASSIADQGLGASGNYIYTLNQTNAKATTKFDGVTVSAACWLMKKGDSC